MDPVVARIIEAMGQMQMDQKTLASKIGVRPQAITEWKKGTTASYTKYLPQIAEALEVSVEHLITGADVPTGAAVALNVPVLGDVAAGIPIEAITDIVDYEEIDAALAGSGEYFGLRIKGDSMMPRMMAGDVVIVRKQEDIESGDVAVVMVNGDCATVKKVKKGPDGITLIPFNPVYGPMEYSNADIEALPVRILGKVVELRAKF